MDKTAQLARRLGHATSKAVISIINSGVMNRLHRRPQHGCREGSVHCRADWEDDKKASVSPGYVIATRVTQVQQILSVNIISVKKIAFLLGMFIPPGLGLVRYLRDRSEAEVGTAV